MREIKFRAWDKENKCWINPSKIALKEEEYQDLIYCDMAGFGIMEDGSLILTDECGQYRALDSDRFDVLQFTGLYDMNCKEIYEGDIVRYENFYTAYSAEDLYILSEVRYCKGAFCILDNGCWQAFTKVIASEETEVIGNIYENKRESSCL